MDKKAVDIIGLSSYTDIIKETDCGPGRNVFQSIYRVFAKRK